MTNQIQEGLVTLVLPEDLEVDPKAGTMTDADVRSIARARSGLGVTCNRVATELEKAGTEFMVPGVTATALREAGERAETWDEVIEDIELALRTAKQANLLADAQAFTMLRKVNAQVKAQSAFTPKLAERFTAITDYFATKRRNTTDDSGEVGE